jgi:hypothetical protein
MRDLEGSAAFDLSASKSKDDNPDQVIASIHVCVYPRSPLPESIESTAIATSDIRHPPQSQGDNVNWAGTYEGQRS